MFFKFGESALVEKVEFEVKEHKYLPKFISRRMEGFDCVILLVLCGSIFFILDPIGFNLEQRLSTTIFAAIVLGTLMFWRFRLAIALVGISLLLFTGVLPLQGALTYMNLDVIIFLVSMMIIIEELEHVGFFRYIGLTLVKKVNYNPTKLMVTNAPIIKRLEMIYDFDFLTSDRFASWNSKVLLLIDFIIKLTHHMTAIVGAFLKCLKLIL